MLAECLDDCLAFLAFVGIMDVEAIGKHEMIGAFEASIPCDAVVGRSIRRFALLSIGVVLRHDVSF